MASKLRDFERLKTTKFSRDNPNGLYNSKSPEMMGDKYKRNFKVHGPILIDHYYSFRLHNDEFQSLIRTKKLL